ncbi:MAG: hypothetical protein N2037_11335, partial [Acidimicrobiales bacterium]|nr:hypothetical protein [Acidimicrobiales bacterium]
MRRLVPALSTVLGAAVLLLSSACSVIDPPALKAGDLTLTRKEFIAELDALAQAPELLAQLGVSTPVSKASVGTTRPSSYDTALTAAVLNLHLRFILFDRLAAQFGIEVNPGEEAQAASQVDQLIGTSDTFKSGAGERFRKQLIRMFALFPRVQSKLAEGIDYSSRALEFYEARKGSLPVRTCLGLIAFVEVPVDAQGRLERQPSEEEKAVSQRRAQAVYD